MADKARNSIRDTPDKVTGGWRPLAALLAGLVFGMGLLRSGMADPAKVLGFLDLAGAWDPSMAFVMGGAIGIGLPLFAVAKRQRDAWLGGGMMLPTARQIDRPLLIGSLLFGVGWGLAGICPGPSLVLLGLGLPEGVLFVAAMAAGMLLFQGWSRWRSHHGA